MRSYIRKQSNLVFLVTHAHSCMASVLPAHFLCEFVTKPVALRPRCSISGLLYSFTADPRKTLNVLLNNNQFILIFLQLLDCFSWFDLAAALVVDQFFWVVMYLTVAWLPRSLLITCDGKTKSLPHVSSVSRTTMRRDTSFHRDSPNNSIHSYLVKVHCSADCWKRITS